MAGELAHGGGDGRNSQIELKQKNFFFLSLHTIYLGPNPMRVYTST